MLLILYLRWLLTSMHVSKKSCSMIIEKKSLSIQAAVTRAIERCVLRFKGPCTKVHGPSNRIVITWILLPEMSAERKKQTCAGHCSSTMKLLTKIYDVLETSPIDCDKLTMLKLGLNEKHSKLRTLHDEIVDLIGKEDLAAEIEQADEYIERMHEALARMGKVLQEFIVAIHHGPATGPPLEVRTSSVPHATLPPSHKVKLPKISLPWFSGSPLKWSGFWDSFSSAVHSNPELSEAEKLTTSAPCWKALPMML